MAINLDVNVSRRFRALSQSDRLPWSFAFWSSWLCYVPRVLSQENLTPANWFSFRNLNHVKLKIPQESNFISEPVSASLVPEILLKWIWLRLPIPSSYIEFIKSLAWFVFIPPHSLDKLPPNPHLFAPALAPELLIHWLSFEASQASGIRILIRHWQAEISGYWFHMISIGQRAANVMNANEDHHRICWMGKMEGTKLAKQ